MNNQRIEWIDTLKFIGMFYIYIGHLGAASGKLYPFVFSFHVPLFFFMSGLLYKKREGLLGLANKIRNSFVKIIIPYIVFSLIGVFIYAIKWNLPTERINEMLLNAAFGIRNQVPITSLWFLPCLFLVVIYYSILDYLVKNRLVIFILSFALYCMTPWWWDGKPSIFLNIDSAAHYLSYFAIGVLLSKKVTIDWTAAYESKYKIVVSSVIIFSFLYFAYSFQNGTFSLFAAVHQLHFRYVIFFFVTLIMFIPSIAIAYWIKLDAFKKLGRNSILLCGTEQIVKVILPTLFAVVGLKIQYKDPLQAVLFASMCFVFSYFTILKIYESASFRVSTKNTT